MVLDAFGQMDLLSQGLSTTGSSPCQAFTPLSYRHALLTLPDVTSVSSSLVTHPGDSGRTGVCYPTVAGLSVCFETLGSSIRKLLIINSVSYYS